MSLKYTLPPSDSEEYTRWAKERDAQWQALASAALDKDPEFQAWKKRHWLVFGTAAGVSGIAYLSMAISTYDSQQPNPRIFAGVFVFPLIILALARIQYSAKVRKIGLREWMNARKGR